MGADFIQKTKRTFKKSWDQGRVALGTADFFTRAPSYAARSAPFDMADNAKLQVGEQLTVEKDGERLVARRRLSEVARNDRPPRELMCAVEASCGVAKGTVKQVHDLAGVAEISLC